MKFCLLMTRAYGRTCILIENRASQTLSSLGFPELQCVIYSYGEHVTAAFSIGNRLSNLLLFRRVGALGVMQRESELNI